jgi:ferredoxin
VDACPVQALTLTGNQPQLAPAACVRCGLCTPTCPTDVFSPPLPYAGKLRATVAQLPQEPTALVCAAHPTPSLTAANVSAIVQHRQCLAALAPADLLELSAGGRRPLWLDDAPCATCPIGAAQQMLQRTVATTRAWLHAAGRPPALLLHSERPPRADAPSQRRPLFDGAQPTLSRRAFLIQRQPGSSHAAPEPAVTDWLERGAPLSTRLPQALPASRQSLLAALAATAAATAGALPAATIPFTAVQVDPDRCSACGLCARFCPTGALHFTAEAAAFALALQPAACVECNICVAACPEGAVSYGGYLTLSSLLADELTPLAAGTLAPCVGCGTPTAAQTEEPAPRCHVCRQGAGVVTSLRDEAGLMADLLKRT